MAIEIQHHRSDRPEIIDRILHLVAPRGWNANTQFFLVFLVVLAVHLWVAPVLMRSAADLEPGDPQGYFSSQGNEVVVSEATVPDVASDAEEASQAVVTKPIGFEKDKLILTDATIVAEPITESKPEEKIDEPASALPESEVAPAMVAEASPVSEKAAASPTTATTVADSPGKLAVKAPELAKDQPRLSDLIVEAPPARRDPAESPASAAAAVPANSAKPGGAPAKPASGEGMRQFRQLR